MEIRGKFIFLAGLIIALLLSGCANSTRVIQNVGLGNDSLSLGWAGYPKDGIGMIIDVKSYRFDDPITGESEGAGGIHLGVTRKLNDKVGAHLVWELAEVPVPWFRMGDLSLEYSISQRASFHWACNLMESKMKPWSSLESRTRYGS